MLKYGQWNTKVAIDKYPQKVASAISEFESEPRFGCEFRSVAYLADQTVNGTNHAVLAQQTVLNGRDTNNAVILIFNEKPGSMDVALIETRRIVESGGPLGGVKVNITTDIPKEAKDVFNDAHSAWTGSKIVPFAYIGNQVVRGIDHIFAATLQVVGPQEYPAELVLVKVNSLEPKMKVVRMFEIGGDDNIDTINSLGYAFTWLANK